jgi:hypothetical protein
MSQRGSGAAQAVVFYVPGKPHGSDWLGLETRPEAGWNREISVPTPQAHVGKLARDARDSPQELMELGGWKSYEMVLRYAHLAPEHLSTAAARIERELEVVTTGATISLR